jgi:ABC-type bacteriocin/lantibiotic exporter with double-glycine peptidase domain
MTASSPRSRSRSRSRSVPEVIQTSAMDCGPACLAALLGGFGVNASYERLREACQTDVDGTSIDTIEEAAVQLGLAAQQIIVPVDHVLLSEAGALPAIAITRLPDGNNHFVVLWRRTRRGVEVMDPAIGRRTVTAARLRDELYVHEMELPADAWRGWAADELTAPLGRRLRALGMPDPAPALAAALADPTWRGIAALDAAARMVQRLVDVRALAPGAAAADLVRSLAGATAPAAEIPEEYWTARPPATDDPDQVRVRGAVLVRVTGHTPAEPTSPELAAALAEPPVRPWYHLRAAIADGGRLVPLAVLAATAIAALMFVVQAALWRAMFDTAELTTPQVGAALATLAVFLALDLCVNAMLAVGVLGLGRRLEVLLRLRFLGAIGRLGLHYLRSRPISDMAERSHSLHRVRELPWIASRILTAALVVIASGVALAWLAPESAWLVVGLVVACIAPPLLGHRALAERELRVRVQNGTLARFSLDALLGAVPVRAHGAERTLRREHEARLVEWTRAAQREHGLASAIAAIQLVLVTGFVIALVATHAASTARPASILLMVYWTVGMALHGVNLTAYVRELPVHRNLTLRLLEPLASRPRVAGEPATTEPAASVVSVAAANAGAAAAIALDGVGVVAGGHVVLADVTLAIAAGEHVAVVGRSGSGKSTLLGLLLGWHRAAAGTVSVDGAPLDARALAALRTRTAWVDPAIQLWNDTLAANLTFGATAGGRTEAPDVGAAAVAAQLEGVLARLPEGMQTPLGEGGGLVSGGEGQRVRFGRALLRDRPALVILDEPFRGIDRDQRRRLLDAARARWSDATLLCATHDLAETRGFDRVLVIEAGRVVEDGAPEELAARAGSRYQALLAEETATAALWARWRHLRLERGQLVEDPP